MYGPLPEEIIPEALILEDSTPIEYLLSSI